ncbi:hypothetical protein [Hymenobacter sp. B81]|uniref:hypothetical protein n=1 Tax=Hymenobacter sp. B81 TaxID=3344878 RepID=UPI0037DD3170
METTTAAGITPGEMLLLSSARRNVREVLNHPAFPAERRQRAEAVINACTDAAQLLRWKQLALRECEAWEDAELIKEANLLGPAAHPDYLF